MLIGQAHVDVSEETIARLRNGARPRQIDPGAIPGMGRRAVTGDFGRSIQSRQPVWDVVRPRIIPTVQIGLTAWMIALLAGIPVGIVSAVSPNTWKDWLGSVGALVGAAMPYFLVGGLLIYFVALKWGLLPASGFVSPFVDFGASMKTTLLPALTLSLGLAAVTARQTRSSFSDVMQRAFIKTARAKGLHEGRVILNHAFKNAMLPVVTILGIQLATMFSGTVITETIFAVPGVGRLLVDSILSRDYPVVQAVVLFISLMVVTAIWQSTSCTAFSIPSSGRLNGRRRQGRNAEQRRDHQRGWHARAHACRTATARAHPHGARGSRPRHTRHRDGALRTVHGLQSPDEIDTLAMLSGPTASHILGTDDLGRDTFSRLVYGARVSLSAEHDCHRAGDARRRAARFVAGYVGGVLDEVVMRLLDSVMALPPLVLALTIAAVLGPGLVNGMLAIAVVAVPTYTRLVRGQVLSVKHDDYVLAARSIGARDRAIIFRHVLPNWINPVIVQAALGVGFAIITESSLSFIGLGAQPPTPSWRSDGAGCDFSISSWRHGSCSHRPSLIFIAVLGFNLLGEGLRDMLDPNAARADRVC